MKIKKIRIENFRCYEAETTIELGNLSVFVGKNDVGKSTILEALDIFFNENKGVIKIDKDDINKHCQEDGNNDVKISVVFEDLPKELVIDTKNPTTLKSEYLLRPDGTLEIIKLYPNAGKEKVFIRAHHPTNPNCSELLLKTITDLKKVLPKDCECNDKTKSAEIRKAIWNHHSDNLMIEDVEIELTKSDAKSIWENLKNYLPLYSLFQSDRKNSDGDSEVQNPLRIAVKEILEDSKLRDHLDEVAKEVERKLTEVSSLTLEKLNEMNPNLAKSLNPVIPSPDSLKCGGCI